MDARARFHSVTVGALPVLSAFMDQWGLAKILDDVVPWEGDVPLGTLVEILVLNRLQRPEAQYAIGEWAAESGVADFYGLTAEQLNDDLLGRALERLNQHAESAQTPLTLAAVKRWRLKIRTIHYDISNAEFYGAFADAQPSADKDSGTGPSPQQAPPAPFPTYGRTRAVARTSSRSVRHERDDGRQRAAESSSPRRQCRRSPHACGQSAAADGCCPAAAFCTPTPSWIRRKT